jgi:hypothetical protein
MVAQLASLRDTSDHSFAGLMAREDLSERSSFASVGTANGKRIEFRQRSAEFGPSHGFTSPVEGGAWLKVARVQGTIGAFVSKDAQTWAFVDFTSIGSANRIQVGPVVDSGARDVRTTAEFRSVNARPVSEPLVATNLTTPQFRIVSEPALLGTNTVIRILVAGPPDSTYLVEASDAFTDWQAIGTLTNQLGLASFTIPAGTGDVRFFRLRNRQ